MKTINKIAYFLDDFVIFFIIYLSFIGTSMITFFYLAHNKVVSETNITITLFAMIGVCLIPFFIYWIADGIVDSELKASTRKVKYKATAYTKKILRTNDDEETYYLIKTENETKIVKASALLINKKDKFADSEHRAGTADIEYIEVELVKNLPQYKREKFNDKKMGSFEGRNEYKNQLNIVNYVSKEV
ncbi:hypothetical protein [Ligilactobacillus salivarius]|uniref:Uncharacterized protein n=1 Tax=Ligilactobacillus salivarius TaxID=1624 RepID=A0AAX3X7Y3_9LACO|nr:hypothetical protein [Ligilactobacillus salivarius]WII29753.1 hypothetical protein QFE45_10825 [Ligilactobacillus salivarius]